MLLRIKEFAEFCGLSVRALHLYDKRNLFTPITINKNNGYRYYDTEQMMELNIILSFKKIGFSLDDIKELKLHHYSKDMVILKLKDKYKENLRQIEIVSYNNEIIDSMLLQLGKNSQEDEPDDKHLAKIICMENDKLDSLLSQILWL
jgi:DNA-binding transcriptional MerR regulator